MFDTAILGAGPAGAVAALGLARAGQRVVMIDDVEDGAVKLGETLAPGGARVLHQLDLGRLLGPPHTTVPGQLSLWDDRGVVPTDFFASPHGRAWRLDRSRFDADLRAAARAAGAVMVRGRAMEVSRRGAGWQVTAGETLEAGHLIDATGRRAWLARRLGARVVRDDDQVALYARWSPDTAMTTTRTLVERVADGSWWYAARLPDGDVIAGLHLPAKAAATVWRAPHQWCAKLAATSLIARHLTPPDTITLLPPHSATGSITSPTEGDGWHAIGDAAMAYDPLSGFGIHAALQDAVWLTDGTPSVERARRRAAIRLAYLQQMRPNYALGAR